MIAVIRIKGQVGLKKT